MIRVNSQSGKGGIAYVLKNDHKLDLPRRMKIEFSKIIQAKTDAEGGEVTPKDIWAIFQDEYLPNPDNAWGRIQVKAGQTTTDRDGIDSLTVEASVDGTDTVLTGTGNGPISAFFDALQSVGIDARLLDYQEHTMSEGASAQAAGHRARDRRQGPVGSVPHANTTRASLKAVVSAVNRAAR